MCVREEVERRAGECVSRGPLHVWSSHWERNVREQRTSTAVHLHVFRLLPQDLARISITEVDEVAGVCVCVSGERAGTRRVERVSMSALVGQTGVPLHDGILWPITFGIERAKRCSVRESSGWREGG